MFDVNDQSISKVSKCLVCPYAKQTRLTFPSSYIISLHIFDLIHVDLWGPYNTSTFDGNKYFLTIVDDFFRMTWLCMLKHKYEVSMFIKLFPRFVQT